MWRCKWTELRLKELGSQSLKYSRALAEYKQGKNSGLDPTEEDFSSKAFPFSSQYYRRKAMKRRKRKRAEDTSDTSSYMSQHNIFSYFGTSFNLVVITSCFVTFHLLLNAIVSFCNFCFLIQKIRDLN